MRAYRFLGEGFFSFVFLSYLMEDLPAFILLDLRLGPIPSEANAENEYLFRATHLRLHQTPS